MRRVDGAGGVALRMLESPTPTPDGGEGFVAESTSWFQRIPFGITAFVIAVVLAITEVLAITLSNSGSLAQATVIAQVLIVVTALPVVVGIYSLVRGSGRWWGAAAIVVAALANPIILTSILVFFGGL